MTFNRKLIEVALPLATINAEAAREKSIRHGHPSTLHLWWARRPLAAARAVLWASLVDDPSAHPEAFPTEEAQRLERMRLFDILERLVPWDASQDQSILTEARAEITQSCDGDLPKILDPFGGGGAIPLEALRLGMPTFTGDLNPVAVLIQRAMLEIPSRFANRSPVNRNSASPELIREGTNGLAADVESYGKWMQEEARRRIGHYYEDATLPDGSTATPIAWIWARTVKSPDPSWAGHVPLVRSWILAKKLGKPTTWIEPIVSRDTQTITYKIRHGGAPVEPTVSGANGICIATGTPIPAGYIKSEGIAGRTGTILLAIVCETKRGRAYVPPPAKDLNVWLPQAPWIPTGTMSNHPQYMGTPRYGLDEWWKLFTSRQLMALTTFSDLLAQVRTMVIGEAASAGWPADDRRLRDGGAGPPAYADAIVTYLAFVIDKCADYWSSLCSWHNTGEKIRNTFGRQALPMTWDFAETNPFSTSTGNWMAMVDWVVKALRAVPTGREADVAQRDARVRVREVGRCVLSTDPPYYDNVPYSDIADFFYVWLRHNLADVWPDECATLLTPKADELVANQYRAGSKSAAYQHFESGMEQVFTEAAISADPRFPATIFYAFKATESSDDGVASTGWETFLRGLLQAGYSITATWPIRTELGSRMRAFDSNALASSIVLACRPRQLTAPMATRGEFIARLRTDMGPAIRLLQVENIAPVDMAQSAMGPGIAIFSRYARVVEADGTTMSVRTALGLINEVLSEVLSGEESEFDADTRFALTWFEQYGHGSGPFGDADLLARAKNTTVTGVSAAGIVLSRDGKVRLVERSQLRAGWDPAFNSRLTVWETTQQLIQAANSSEVEAAALLARIGIGLGERARLLAYLLYGICERKRWADEAVAYNMLVSDWPEISRLAAAAPDSPLEEELF